VISDIFISVALGRETSGVSIHNRIIEFRDGERIAVQKFVNREQHRADIHSRLDVVLDDLQEKMGKKTAEAASHDGS